ncbi:MAG: C39 family peptidase [Ardenticatenaceae bacterium]|nr:C39 family peptidase [Ardenticatenaceae bacterium]
MMKKRWVWLWVPIVLLGLLIWSVPALLRAMPDRYVARLPEPLQQLGAPQTESAVLPTLAQPVDASWLLAATSTAVSPTDVPIPATLTPIATQVVPETAVSPTATPQPSPTPSPTPTATPWPIPPAARLEGITHKFQTWNNCGPATLAMTLSYFGYAVTQDDTASVLKPDPEDRNVSPDEMAAYVNGQTPYRALYRTNGTQQTVQRLLANGIPVIVEVGIDPPGEYRWLGWYGHYLLVVAYDEAQQQFWVYDSWFGTSEEPLTNANENGRVLSFADFATYWPHFNRNYIALYEPAQADLVAAIIGADMDTEVMWQHALTVAQEEAAAAPDNAFFWFNLGTSYNALHQYDKAAAAFDQALAIGLPWRMLWYQFGPYEAFYQVGRYEDVVLLADTTLQDRPYFEESYYYKGLALTALGQADEGRANLERAAAFNPNFSPAQIALEEIGD